MLSQNQASIYFLQQPRFAAFFLDFSNDLDVMNLLMCALFDISTYLNRRRQQMSSKLQGKISRLQLKLNKQSKQKLCCSYETTLDKSCYVQAQMKNKKQWLKGRILDIRLSKDYDATQPRDEQSYSYYVHFEDYDKRNDDWIPHNRIRSTSIKIDDSSTHEQKPSHINDDIHYGMNASKLQAHQQITKFKTIFRLQLGKYATDAWYFSPYPIYYHNLDCLYICDFCLSFFSLEIELKRHSQVCPLYHPPGDQIYRDQECKVAVFEVDGNKNPVYCQNLAFLSKLFLDHKNLHQDMSIFLFYILCQIEDNQYHIAGYFSKVKQTQNNLSCILTLPFYQRKGYGKFLISFSYELSLMQQKVGGPQKPLSDLGRQTYLSWWSQRIITFIRENKEESYTLADMSRKTGITQQDIKWTMDKIKVLKVSNGQPYICTDQAHLAAMYKLAGRPGLRVLPEKIHYIPFKLKWDNPSAFI